MSSNLPPGVTENMIPGNRPEDEEVEIVMNFTKGDISNLRYYYHEQIKKPRQNRHELWAIVENMIELFSEDGL